MPAYNFQLRFAPLVEQGLKPCTIRRPRKTPTKPGDTLTLYTGQRTKQCRLLKRTPCTAVRPVLIVGDEFWLDGVKLSSGELDALARRDADMTAREFLNFFHETYDVADDPHFELIEWEP